MHIFLLDLSICNDYSVLATILFIKKILNIIWIALPVILVLFLTIDILKAVMAGDNNQMEEVKKIAVKRIFYAIAAFLIPVMVNTAFSLIGDRTTGIFTCYSNANNETVSEAYVALQEQEEARAIQRYAERKAKEEGEVSTSESDIAKYSNVSKTTGTSYNSTSLASNRVQALKPWKDAMDVQFNYSKGQKYNFVGCKNPKALKCPSIANSKKMGSCITFPMVSLMRLNILPEHTFLWHARTKSGSVNYSTQINKKSIAYKYIVNHPGYYKLTPYYAKKTMQQLINSGSVEYGDIISAQGHQFVYMGTPSNKYYYYTMGRGNMGNSKKSAGIGDRPSYRKWKVVSVLHIKTHSIKTFVTNGKITKGGLIMASRDATITYSPKPGYVLKSVRVDGKNVSISQYSTSYTFKNVSKDHTIQVTYELKKA